MKKNSIHEWTGAFGMNVIITHRYIFLLLAAVLVFAGFQGMQRVVMDSSNESFLPEGDATIELNDRFKEIFGNEEFVFILLETDDVFTHDVLAYIRELGEDIEENLPFVKEVTSLTNVEYTEVAEDTLYVEDLIGEEIPTDPAVLKELKRKTLAKKMYVDRLVTQDSRATGISISFELIPETIYAAVDSGFSPLDEMAWPDDEVLMSGDLFTKEQMERRPDQKLNPISDPRKLIAPALQVILRRHPTEAYTIKTTGIPVMDFEGDWITTSEASKFGLIALVASIALLVAIFRSLTAVIAPFLVLASTIILVYGLMGWVGMPVSMTSMIIPPLLLVISVSYSIHLINHFRQAFEKTGIRAASLRYAYQHSAWPCFLTAVTTAMGFASFVIVPIKPLRDVGLACAFGAFATYFLVMVLVPVFFSFGRDRNEAAHVSHKVGKIDAPPIMTRWADFVIQNPVMVGIAALVVTAALLGFGTKFRVESDMMEVMGDRVEAVRDSVYIADRLGGMYSYEVFIELPEDGMAKRPDVLRTVDRIAGEVETWPSTSLTMSLTNIVKDLNMTMNNNDDAYDAIPDDQELIAQYLLLYEMSGGAEMDEWVDYDYRSLRLSVQVRNAAMDIADKLDEIKQYAGTFPAGTQVSIAGDIPILLKMLLLLSYGQLKSVLAAMVVITFTMMVILKSVRVGLIAMIPNVFPVIAIAGVMGFLDYPLDIITIMVAPMIIGIAVDDTIHYIVHFKQEYELSGSYIIANRETFGKVGTAIVFTSVILTIGFSIFGLSVVNSMLHMAVLSSVGILAALAADLFITPVMFVYFKPFGETAQTIHETGNVVSETV